MKVKCVSSESVTGRSKGYVTQGKIYDAEFSTLAFKDPWVVIVDDEGQTISVKVGKPGLHGLFEIAD